MARNEEVSLLLDFYGEMLTQKQQDCLEYYYNEDLSLSEIAENEGITRQGVRDSIKRAENQLYYMEEKLGLVKRFEKMREGLDEIIDCVSFISDYNLHTIESDEINSSTERIKSIANELQAQ